MKIIPLALLTLILTGCSTNGTIIKRKPLINPQANQATQTKPALPSKPKPIPSQPKKKIQLKEVQKENYSAAYMYPEDEVKQPTIEPDTPKQEATPTQVTKEECITMIGQEKFDKYTQMFSDESATIKRCTMMKAMQQ